MGGTLIGCANCKINDISRALNHLGEDGTLHYIDLSQRFQGLVGGQKISKMVAHLQEL